MKKKNTPTERLVFLWLIISSALLFMLTIYIILVPEMNVNIHEGNYTIDIGDNIKEIYSEKIASDSFREGCEYAFDRIRSNMDAVGINGFMRTDCMEGGE